MAADDANVAKELAFMAMITAQAHGRLFESLIGTLRDQDLLSNPQIKIVFFGAVANVDSMPAANDFQKRAQIEMRKVIAAVAQGVGIQIPPPGETGIQRKH